MATATAVTCSLYRQWKKSQDVVLRQDHRADGKLFLDWSADQIKNICQLIGCLQNGIKTRDPIPDTISIALCRIGTARYDCTQQVGRVSVVVPPAQFGPVTVIVILVQGGCGGVHGPPGLPALQLVDGLHCFEVTLVMSKT